MSKIYVTLASSNLQLVPLDYDYLLCCKTNMYLTLHQTNIFMTVHYESKLERQARSLFQVKIGLAGLTVKSKATELNSKARTTEYKTF